MLFRIKDKFFNFFAVIQTNSLWSIQLSFSTIKRLGCC